MLDRKTKLIIFALFSVMMASDIWLVAHAVRWPAVPSFLAYRGRWLAILFLLPACMMICIGAWQWRMARAEGDLAAGTRWVRFLAICYTATGAGHQLWLAMTISEGATVTLVFVVDTRADRLFCGADARSWKLEGQIAAAQSVATG
jgi:hypothetical protein